MTKAVADAVLDASLSYIKTHTQRQVLCSAAPANYAGVAAIELADVAMAGGNFTGPADGDVSGRKLTINAMAGVDVDTTGTGTHVVLVDDTNTLLLYTDSCTAVNVDAAGTVDIGSWKIEIADPT